jgi:hypothetical protein
MTQDEIRAMFEYEPATGLLRRKVGGRKPYPWHGAGKDRRYLVHCRGARSIYLHQAVWLYHHGYVPAMLDHVNGDTRDNRIENLRECTNAQNQYNVPRKSNNTHGHKGVVFHRACRSRPWQAKIVVSGKVISLGYHATKEEAAAAYAAGAAKYAGDFARIN